MMTGMAYELGATWRRDDGVTTARDSMHYRAAMESQAARRAGAKPALRHGLLDRLVTTFQATTGARSAAR